MSVDPKRPLGMGHGPGSQPFTQLGNSLQGITHQHQAIDPDITKIYSGWLYDVRLPLEDSDVREFGRAGVWARMRFDSPSVDREWSRQWFRLKHDAAELLHTYGTEDSIRSHRLRAHLKVSGAAIRRGDMHVVGDTYQEYQYRGLQDTPVKAWGDIIYGISSGKLPGG